MKLDRVAKATEQVFIAGCRDYVENIPDTVVQASAPLTYQYLLN